MFSGPIFLPYQCVDQNTILIKEKLLAMHTLIGVTFLLPPGVRGWPRLLLVALPGLFWLSFFFFVIIKLFLRKTCLDGVSIKLNNLVSYTYAIVNIRASARDYLSFRKLLQTTFENLTRDIYSLAMISKNIRKKSKNWTYLFIFCLFVCLFVYLFIYFFFHFIFFLFFLSFFLSFFLYLFIDLFWNFPAL